MNLPAATEFPGRQDSLRTHPPNAVRMDRENLRDLANANQQWVHDDLLRYIPDRHFLDDYRINFFELGILLDHVQLVGGLNLAFCGAGIRQPRFQVSYTGRKVTAGPFFKNLIGLRSYCLMVNLTSLYNPA